MKITISKSLKDIENNDLKSQTGKTITLKDVCIVSLLVPVKDEDDKSRFSKYETWKKIRDAKDDIVELSSEEIVLLKGLIGKNEAQLVMGQCWDMLEGQ
jgi:hypothetical protein